MDIEEAAPVGQLARHYPSLISQFEQFDIDYASKGGRSVRDAAVAAGLSVEEVLASLKRVSGAAPVAEQSLPEIIHTIVTQHHRLATDQVHEIMKRLDGEVAQPPDVMRIRRLFADVARVLAGHMLREERYLFPPIEELALHPHRVRAGSMSRPLLAEFVEHDMVHESLVTIRHLVARLRAVSGVDVVLLDMLDAFDRDAHRHIHIENNILIPRVIELENQVKSARRAEARAH